MSSNVFISTSISIYISQAVSPVSFMSLLLCNLKHLEYVKLNVTVQLRQLNVPITKYITVECNLSLITYITF